MDARALRQHLTAMSARDATRFLSTLSERKLRELEFHDRDRAASSQERETGARYRNRKYYSVTRASQEYVDEWLARAVPGRVFLDYACGSGRRVIQAAKAGSTLAVGIDISDVSLDLGRGRAEQEGVADRCCFVQADCEETGLPDGCVDVVLCSGMLHHLDLSYAFPELRRILRAGGRILGVEALNYNPALRLYRKLTPGMRTEWEAEHILSLKDLELARRFFDVRDVRFWHLSSLLATPFRRRERVFHAVLAPLERVDALLARVPGVRLMSWQFTFELVKRPEAGRA